MYAAPGLRGGTSFGDAQHMAFSGTHRLTHEAIQRIHSRDARRIRSDSFTISSVAVQDEWRIGVKVSPSTVASAVARNAIRRRIVGILEHLARDPGFNDGFYALILVTREPNGTRSAIAAQVRAICRESGILRL